MTKITFTNEPVVPKVNLDGCDLKAGTVFQCEGFGFRDGSDSDGGDWYFDGQTVSALGRPVFYSVTEISTIYNFRLLTPELLHTPSEPKGLDLSKFESERDIPNGFYKIISDGYDRGLWQKNDSGWSAINGDNTMSFSEGERIMKRSNLRCVVIDVKDHRSRLLPVDVKIECTYV